MRALTIDPDRVRHAAINWQKAIHEAGHAVVGTIMGRELEYVTVDPKAHGAPDHVGGHAEWVPGNYKPGGSLLSGLAGHVAEVLSLGREHAWPLHGTDHMNVFGELDQMFNLPVNRDAGMTDQHLERAMLNYLHQSAGPRCEKILLDNWDAVEAVAKALLRQGTLSGDEVRAIVQVGAVTSTALTASRSTRRCR